MITVSHVPLNIYHPVINRPHHNRDFLSSPLPPLPVTNTTAATLCGQLVMIGGKRGRSPVNSIHQLVDGQWVEIGSKSSNGYWCLVVSPSPEKVMIVGGRGGIFGVITDSIEELCIY